MQDPFVHLTLIVQPCDLTDPETVAFAHALRLSVATGADLRLINVADGTHARPEAFPHASAMLARWHPRTERGVSITKSIEGKGSAEAHIRALVEAERPDLLVLSPHQRHGIDRLLHPSVSELLARHVPAMTLFVPRGAKPFVDVETGVASLRNIVVPVAKDLDATAAIHAALGLARALESGPTHLTLLHAGDERDLPSLDEVPARLGVKYDRIARRGRVVDVIVECVTEKSADLIVMMTEGRTTLLDWITGDTTEQLLSRTPCAVLAIPA